MESRTWHLLLNHVGLLAQAESDQDQIQVNAGVDRVNYLGSFPSSLRSSNVGAFLSLSEIFSSDKGNPQLMPIA